MTTFVAGCLMAGGVQAEAKATRKASAKSPKTTAVEPERPQEVTGSRILRRDKKDLAKYQKDQGLVVISQLDLQRSGSASVAEAIKRSGRAH